MNLVSPPEIYAGRITVDLTLFFQDFKKYCVVYLNYNRIKTVQDLKCFLKDTFNLKQQFIMMLEDCLLLENDDLRVLRNGDHIWLADPVNFVPVESSSRSAQSSKQIETKDDTHLNLCSNLSASSPALLNSAASNGISNGHLERINECEAEMHNLSKKRKYITEGSVANAARQQEREIENYLEKTKKKQISKPNVDIMPLEVKTISVDSKAQSTFLVQNSASVEKSKNSTLRSCGKSAERENSEEESELDWNSVPLPKRKRIRKRRSKKSKITSIVSLPIELLKQTKSCIYAVPQTIKQQAGRVHIRFDEKKNHEDEIPNGEEMQTDETYSLQHVQPQVLNPAKNEQSNLQSMDLSQLLNIKKPIIFERKREETVQITLDVQTNTEIKMWNNISDEEIWNCPTISEAPKQNDFVAFRVLHLSTDYTPQLSPWILARVTKEQSVNKEKMTLEIQRGSNPFYRDTTGKFEVEETLNEQKGSMEIEWQKMITPRNITNFK